MKFNKKKLLSLILTGSLVVSLAGCQKTSNTEEILKQEAKVEQAATKTVVDHEGVEVEIPTKIDRIVVGIRMAFSIST